jgi:hypothetical protein
MNFLRNIPMATLAIVVGTLTAIAWITMEGTAPLVITMVLGALIAIKATLGDGE